MFLIKTTKLLMVLIEMLMKLMLTIKKYVIVTDTDVIYEEKYETENSTGS